jgi:hypothetical protein
MKRRNHVAPKSPSKKWTPFKLGSTFVPVTKQPNLATFPFGEYFMHELGTFATVTRSMALAVIKTLNSGFCVSPHAAPVSRENLCFPEVSCFVSWLPEASYAGSERQGR